MTACGIEFTIVWPHSHFVRFLKKCGLDEMLSVIDSNGKVCFAQSIKAGQESMEISTNGMPAGMYIIRVIDGNKEVDNCRIIIR